jgi:hypothetical protein
MYFGHYKGFYSIMLVYKQSKILKTFSTELLKIRFDPSAHCAEI